MHGVKILAGKKLQPKLWQFIKKFWVKLKDLAKHWLFLLILLILTLFAIKPYFHAGFVYTHDGENHLARFANYKIALKEGQYPPRWAPNLVNHYGYPVFNYNYPLANIISVPFSLVGVNYESTFKLMVGGFILLGLWGIYQWSKVMDFSFFASVVTMGVYTASPYLLSLIYFRGNIGEIAALGLMPWLYYYLELWKAKSEVVNLKWIANRGWLAILVFGSFFLSHNIAVVFGLPLLMVYGLLRNKINRHFWIKFALVVLLAGLLTLWFWLPAVAEKNLVTVGSVSLVNNFAAHFPTLSELIFSPLTFGFSYPGSIDSLSFSIGIIQVIALLLGFVYLLKLKIEFKFTPNFGWLLFLLIGLLLILQLKISLPIWQVIPLVGFIQFPWRLTMLVVPLLAIFTGFVWQLASKNIKYGLLLVLLLQLASSLKLKPADFFHKNIIDYDLFSQSTSTLNENKTPAFTYENIGSWQPAPTLIGDAEITVNHWTGSQRQYQIINDQEVLVIEPTMNFLGWETWDKNDQGLIKLNYSDNEVIQGRLAYQLSAGEHQITTIFTQKTWSRVLGNIVSAITLLFLLLVIGKSRLGKKFHLVLGWRVGLFTIAILAPMFLMYDPSFPYAEALLKTTQLPAWIYSFANFDGVHYLTIAQKGYFGTGLIQAFFPLWPLILALTATTKMKIIWGLLFNFGILALVMMYWEKLLAFDFNEKIIGLASIVLLLFPSSFFFGAVYAEALFFLLVILSFYFARKQRWLKASLVAMLASATRVTGIFLLPALLVELWLQKFPTNQQFTLTNIKQWLFMSKKELLMISLSAFGLLAYMLYLWFVFDDPIYFFHVQAEFGSGRQENFVMYPQVIWRYLKILFTYQPWNLKYVIYLQEFLIGVLGLLALIFSWFKVRKSYVIFSGLAFLLPTLTGTFSSLTRYSLVCFAIIIYLAWLCARYQKFKIIWFSVSTLWLVFNTILFIQGYWVA